MDDAGAADRPAATAPRIQVPCGDSTLALRNAVYNRAHSEQALKALLGCAWFRLDSRDSDGVTPLDAAVAHGTPADVLLLLEAGAPWTDATRAAASSRLREDMAVVLRSWLSRQASQEALRDLD